MIDQSTVDRILDAAQIVDVVQDFVNLKRRGVNYMGLCPKKPLRLPYRRQKAFLNVLVAAKPETLLVL